MSKTLIAFLYLEDTLNWFLYLEGLPSSATVQSEKVQSCVTNIVFHAFAFRHVDLKLSRDRLTLCCHKKAGLEYPTQSVPYRSSKGKLGRSSNTSSDERCYRVELAIICTLRRAGLDDLPGKIASRLQSSIVGRKVVFRAMSQDSISTTLYNWAKIQYAKDTCVTYSTITNNSAMQTRIYCCVPIHHDS